MDTPTWIEPYVDYNAQETVVTVAIPFHAAGMPDVPDIFLGVAGHDFGLHELQTQDFTVNVVFASLRSRAQRCVLAREPPCALQVCRSSQEFHGEKSVCADPFSDQ